jgi:hypothetical protein
MRYRYYVVIQDLQGNVVSDADVYVYKAGTNIPVTVYLAENATQGVSVAPQVTSREDGVVLFWLESTEYEYGQRFDLQVVKGSLSFYLNNVPIIIWDVVHAENADKLNGHDGLYYLNRANHIGESPPTAISPQGSGSELDSDKLDGYDGVYYLNRANHTGTQPPETIAPQGSGSGLDSDKLDGYDGVYYLNRANHTGTQPPETIAPQGSGSGLDSDMVDGMHSWDLIFFSIFFGG